MDAALLGVSDIFKLECEFVWDSTANKLTKGSIPLVQLERRGWITPNPGQEKPDADAGK